MGITEAAHFILKLLNVWNLIKKRRGEHGESVAIGGILSKSNIGIGIYDGGPSTVLWVYIAVLSC